MKKSLSLALVFAFMLAASAFAQSYSVTYSDGTVELKTTQGWTPLSIGDAVPASASVRISQSGSLEMIRGKARITILKDEAYCIPLRARTVTVTKK